MADWFLYPEYLWWLLLALPLIIVHLLKFRPRPFVVPSTRLWREAIQEPVANRFFAPIKNWRELLLQLAALICLVLALAGAQIPEIGTPPRQIIFALDGRASMLAQTNGKSRLEEAKLHMRLLAQSAGAEDTFGLILIGNTAQSLVAPGSSAQSLLVVLDDLALEIQPSDPADFAFALQSAKNGRVEGEEIVFLTGPIQEKEVFPAGLSVQTFGAAIENRGISALNLGEDKLGNLIVTGNLFAPEGAANTPLLLERSSAENPDQTTAESQWVVLDSRFAEGRVVHFSLPATNFVTRQRLRVRFETNDAFPLDDVVSFDWRLLPNLSIEAPNAPLARLLEAFVLEGAPNARPNGAIVLAVDDEAAPLSGDLLRMPSDWWLGVPAPTISLDKIRPLADKPGLTPLLTCNGQVMAGVQTRGTNTNLLISRDLAELGEFQLSNFALALIGSWYRDRQLELVNQDERGIVAPSLLDYRLSERTTFETKLSLEAPPLAGRRLDLYAFALAPWLFGLGLALVVMELLLYLRRAQPAQRKR